MVSAEYEGVKVVTAWCVRMAHPVVSSARGTICTGTIPGTTVQNTTVLEYAIETKNHLPISNMLGAQRYCIRNQHDIPAHHYRLVPRTYGTWYVVRHHAMCSNTSSVLMRYTE